MSNFNDMMAAIADELDDGQGEYKVQIHRAILSALRTLSREPFYFNQTRDVVFETKAGQAWYGEKDHPRIGRLSGLSAVTCQRIKTGSAWNLQSEAPMRLEVMDGSTPPGCPRQFCYFGQKLRLFPRPESHHYQIRLQLLPQGFDPIRDGGQESIWFIEAFDMVFARAKYELYKNILKDGAAAAAAREDFHEQLQLLRAETSRRLGSGRIKATQF